MPPSPQSQRLFDLIWDAAEVQPSRQFWPAQFEGFEGQTLSDVVGLLQELVDAGFLEFYGRLVCSDGHVMWATKDYDELVGEVGQLASEECPECADGEPGGTQASLLYTLTPAWRKRLQKKNHRWPRLAAGPHQASPTPMPPSASPTP